jgi:hypothetical protein
MKNIFQLFFETHYQIDDAIRILKLQNNYPDNKMYYILEDFKFIRTGLLNRIHVVIPNQYYKADDLFCRNELIAIQRRLTNLFD